MMNSCLSGVFLPIKYFSISSIFVSLPTITGSNLILSPIKNLNSLGKNDPTYRSSPRIEAMSIAEVGTSLPLVKRDSSKNEIITPKISFRANPGNNMKDSSSSNRLINADNIFEINRLGLSDSYEAGKSLTLGIDYKLDVTDDLSDKKENEIIKEKYLELKLATVFRDKIGIGLNKQIAMLIIKTNTESAGINLLILLS